MSAEWIHFFEIFYPIELAAAVVLIVWKAIALIRAFHQSRQRRKNEDGEPPAEVSVYSTGYVLLTFLTNGYLYENTSPYFRMALTGLILWGICSALFIAYYVIHRYGICH